MTPSELKQYIFENNKIEDILNDIGCHHIVFHNVEARPYYSCANIDGDNNGAINISFNQYLTVKNYTRENYFDNENGMSDIITLVQYNKSLNDNNFRFRESIKYLHKFLNLELKYTFKQEDSKYDPLAVFKKVKQERFNVLDYHVYDDDILNDYMPMIHIDLYREGIMPWTIKKFGLGYSYRYNRTIIPLRKWDTGELLGTNARTSITNYKELGIKKYIITPSYPKSINLFGLYENYDEIINKGYVVVYESEKSVLKRDSLGDYTGVALSGHTLSDEQVRILIGLNVNIIISLDKDVEINEVRHLCEKIYLCRNVYYTFDKYGLLDDKESIADKSCDIFDFFMEYKIKYDKSEHLKYITETERMKNGGK